MAREQCTSTPHCPFGVGGAWGLPAGFQGVWVPEGKQGLKSARVSAGPRAPETAFPAFRNSKVPYRYLGTADSVPWFCANFQGVVNQ